MGPRRETCAMCSKHAVGTVNGNLKRLLHRGPKWYEMLQLTAKGIEQ